MHFTDEPEYIGLLRETLRVPGASGVFEFASGRILVVAFSVDGPCDAEGVVLSELRPKMVSQACHVHPKKTGMRPYLQTLFRSSSAPERRLPILRERDRDYPRAVRERPPKVFLYHVADASSFSLARLPNQQNQPFRSQYAPSLL